MKIEVTKKHILQGEKSDCKHCPVALAMLEHSSVLKANIGYRVSWFITEGDVYQAIETPVSVSQFAQDFDEGKAVHPFSFDLNLAREVQL